MEIHPPLNVSYFYNGFRKYNIFIFIICLLYLSPELTFGQKKERDPQKKVAICHKGNTISVSLSALETHLAHGDYIGPCVVEGEGEIAPLYTPPKGDVGKIGPELTSLKEKFDDLGSVPSDDIYMVSADKVLIEIIAENFSDIELIKSTIIGYGGIVYDDFSEGVKDLIITVLQPMDKLADLNNDSKINSVRPVYTPILKSGNITSQGDIAVQSENARKAFEIDGSSIKVCVMSDSYNAKQKAQGDIDNGDLPPYIEISEDFSNDFGSHYYVVDEGRAMLQIIHDIAPGASLGFRTGFKGIEHMANGIHILQDIGCRIIVDDITHLTEPFFKDGLISTAVDEVTSNGTIYFSSAGNFANWAYESIFSPDENNPTFHDFGAGGINQIVQFGSAGIYMIVLQWDDVYKSLGELEGPNNQGAENDLNIMMTDQEGNTLFALKTNNLGGDPVEVMPIKVTGEDILANILIERTAGTTENLSFKYIVFVGGSEFQVLNSPYGASTIVGQANASGSYTVGAAHYTETDAYGVNPPIIEVFSSHGGTLIDNDNREKPNFVSADGVNTTVSTIGLDADYDDDFFPNFLGTSAAAPHAAAVAALLIESKSKYGMVDENDFDVGVKMEETALPMSQNGEYDNITGNGFVLADAAIMSFANPIPSITNFEVEGEKDPLTEPFELTIIGKNLTNESTVLLDGTALSEANNVTFVDHSTITASIGPIAISSTIQIITPAKAPNEADGGESEILRIIPVNQKPLITAIAKDTTKLFGELNPVFASTLLINDVPLDESALSETEIERLEATVFNYETASKHWSDTENQYCSPTGTYGIIPISVNTNDSPPYITENYDFDFKKGFLTINKLPITIKPITKENYIYGESFDGIGYEYDLYSDGVDEHENIDNLELLLEYLNTEHKSTFPDGATNAIVDRARQLVNRGRQLVNESGWLISDAALSNRARQLVNGDIAIDLDIDLLTNYVDPSTNEIINPDGTIPNRGRQLVNGEFFYNGGAYIKDELGNRARQLVNEGAVGTIESEGEEFSDITLIVDTTDATISNMYSINLISGLDVNPVDGDPEYEGASQYCVPAAFISPASYNLEINYIETEFNILPAPLNVDVEDKHIFLGDPLPDFTSTIDGYQYNENDSIVFSSITYEPTEYSTSGVYEIIPTFEFRDLVNYDFDPDPINSGELTIQNLVNGRIVLSVENEDGYNDLVLINSNGHDQTPIASVLGSVRDPEFSPNGLEIVFEQQDAETSNLWKVNSDGTGLIQLTTNNNSQMPSYSLDGNKIVYINNNDIATMKTDGSEKVIVNPTPESELWPFFSREGEDIYFVRYRNGSWNLLKVNPISLQETVIYSDDKCLIQPDFKRDGSRIIFTRALNPQSYGDDIMMINPDGTDLTPVTIGTDLGITTFSPDGSKITFVKDNEGIRSLFTMNTDGTNVEFIYDQGTLDVSEPNWGTYPDSYITIPDPNFEQALIDLGIDSDGKLNQQIMRRDTETVTVLDVSDPENNPDLPNVHEKISDLTGIEAFENLEHLDCKFNLITDLNLIDNVRLQHLSCEVNQLTSLDLSSNTTLEYLDCGVNQITNLDLSQNSELNVLICQTNQLIELDLSQNTKLTHLTCWVNQLASLNVSQCPALSELNCNDNQLTDLDISQNTMLGHLQCYSNQISTLDVSQNTLLEHLDCGANKLANLDVSQNNSLRFLNCAYNLIPDLDISQNSLLAHFECHSNQFSSLDVSNNALLEYLDCGTNQLAELNISNNPNLTILQCGHNQINSLDLSNHPALVNLHCGANPLLELDLSTNTALTDLTCYENQLDNLDVSTNTALQSFSCDFNQINSLDVSNNPALTYLFCASNQLTSLDVRNGNNTNFNTFVADNNNLACINVDDETADHSDWIVDLGVSFSNDCSISVPVAIPNENFERALIDLGIDSDGIVNQQISKYDALIVTELDVSDPLNNPNLPNVDTKISDLSGIEAFTNLTRLFCQHNELTSLDVSQNPALIELQCGSNQLTAIDVSQNTALEVFDCQENNLTSLDISQNTLLRSLYLQVNQITELDVTANTKLEELNCDANQIVELDVSQNTQLTWLGCGGNQLTNLDVSQNIDLQTLACYYNGLTSLDVSQQPSLIELLCGSNQLTVLDISNNPNLTILQCGHNQINSLNLSNNTSLVNLHCGANQLNELDLSQNTALTDLTCYENQLTNLDVSTNTALQSFSCDFNQITSLDVSNNTALTYLFCATNQLTTLDVRNGNNANFTTFVADNNNLTCINVDDETADHSTWQVDLGVSFSNDCAVAVPVTITDPNFEQALIDLGIDSDGIVNQQISKYDALVVTELDVSDPENNPNLPNVINKISDLTGIEDFINLTRLYCQLNQLTNLDLSQNTALIQIWCFNNQITELDFSQNPVLNDLLCYENQLTSLDISQNSALTHLNCYGNQLTNLDVSNNTALIGLSCYDNQLPSLDISHNTALTGLDCAGNKLTSLNVSTNTDLTYLSCPFNQLSSLDVSVNTKLVHLLVAGNQFESLDVSTNTAITNLYFEGNQLTSLDVTQNPSLEYLRCFDNLLTSLDLTSNPALMQLECWSNQLANLDVRNGNNANFTTFVAENNNLTCISVDDETANHSTWQVDLGVSFSNDCSLPVNVSIPDPNFEQALIDLGIDSDGVINQQILKSDALAVSSLDVSDPENNSNLPNVNAKIAVLTGIEAFVNLTHLDCEYNLLTNLDVTQNISLTELVCQQNLLTSLDVSQNTSLDFLICSQNQLAELDVTRNNGLTSLYCDFNQLTSLNVSQNTLLRSLSCWDNLMINLDVSQNPQLQFLNCRENMLTNLDVSQNSALNQLYCLSNQLSSLDVSENPALYNLWCSSNQLSTLDISGNPVLIELICHNNQLTSLDISQNTALSRLACYANNITNLDVSVNTALFQIECGFNPITELDFSNNTSLTRLNCQNSQLTSLDLRNGNNSNINIFNAINNNLSCISVDDEGADHSIWNVDADVILSNDCSISHSGARTITGMATSSVDGSSLSGVNIIIKGTTFGVITDLNGNYSMQVTGDDDILVCSFVGYETREVPTGNRSTINISLDAISGFSAISAPEGVSSIVDGNVTLYPNPVVDWLTIEFTDESVVLGDVSITVYNDQPSIEIVGIILSPTVYGFELDFNPLFSGTYYLQLYDGIEVRVFRLIKE